MDSRQLCSKILKTEGQLRGTITGMHTARRLCIFAGLLALHTLFTACGAADSTAVPDAATSCGNLAVDPGEDCDGITSATCSDVGHNAGFPTCTDQCEVSYDACTTITATAIDQVDGVACVITEESGLDCWGENSGGVAEEPRFGALTQVSACGSGYCGLTEDGTISCRDVAYGQPRGSGYRAMGCHFAAIWGITESGSLVISASDEDADVEAMRKYQAFDATRLVHVDLALECGVYDDGAVVCLDAARQALLSDWRIKELSMTTSLANGVPQNPLICGLNFDGTAQCVSEHPAPPPELPTTTDAIIKVLPIRISPAPDYGVCVLDEGGRLSCSDGVQFANEPPADTRWHDIVYLGSTCIDLDCQSIGQQMLGIDDGSTLHRFGDEFGWQTWEGPFVEVAGFGRVGVARHADGDVLHLYPSSDLDTFEPVFVARRTSPTPNFVQVVIDTASRACALDDQGRVSCWGHGVRSVSRIERIEPATEIFMSRSGICGRQLDGSLRCTDNYDGIPTGTVGDASGNDFWGCFYAVDSEGSLHSFGPHATNTCPTFPGAYLTFDFDTKCGLLENQDISCWKTSDDEPDQEARIPGPWTDFVGQLGTVCALDTDNKVSCFARDQSGAFQQVEHDSVPREPVDAIAGQSPFYALRNGKPHRFHPTGFARDMPLELTPWDIPGTKLVATNASHEWSSLCVLSGDDRIRCEMDAPALDAPGAVALAYSRNTLCYQTDDSTQHCFDRENDREFTTPLPGPITAAGDGSICTTDPSDGFNCTPETHTFAFLPGTPGPGVLRGGENGYCFAPENDAAYCFTREAKQPLALDPGLRVIDPGHGSPQDPMWGNTLFMCGLSHAGEVACADQPQDLVLPPKFNPGDPFVDIVVEGWHACAQRQSGSHVCFGRYEDLAIWLSNVPRHEARDLQLQSGDELHVSSQTTCIFNRDTGLNCWGMHAR